MHALYLRLSIILCILASIHLPLTAKTKPVLTITAMPAWHEFANRDTASETRIILCSQVRLKRRGEPVPLKRLSLQWRSPIGYAPAPTIVAAYLYEPKHGTVFNPLDSALIAEGTWHPETRSVHFSLDYKLIGKSTFYLVVHATAENCRRMRRGSFSYSDQFLLGVAPPSREQRLAQKGSPAL